MESKSLNGIYGFFRKRKHSMPLRNINEEKINEIVIEYCKANHDFSGTLKECADLVQDNFDHFVTYITHNL